MGFIVHNSTAIGLVVGAICTLGIFSLLYRENPVYRFFEHAFIGLATGYGLFITWSEVLKTKWWDPMTGQGQWWWALVLIPGAMFYFIYSKRHSWISKVIFGAFMGFGSGLAFQVFANGTIPQVEASFKPLMAAPGTPLAEAVSTVANNFIFVLVLVAVMAYFFFSIDHKAKAMRGTASLGRWFLMFAFGAMFGATVMARMALFIGRVDYLVTDVSTVIPLWVSHYVLPSVLVLGIVLAVFWPKPPRGTEAEETPAASPDAGPE